MNGSDDVRTEPGPGARRATTGISGVSGKGLVGRSDARPTEGTGNAYEIDVPTPGEIILPRLQHATTFRF